MSIKRIFLRLCAAAFLALGASTVIPTERASAQDFSIEFGFGGVNVERNCPRSYDPVCAGPRSNLRTYRNACLARRDEARIRHRGECIVPRVGGGGGGYNDWGGTRVCPEIYAPVCARQRNGATRTLSSQCVADSVGARVLYRGECGRGGSDAVIDSPIYGGGGAFPPNAGGACPRIYSPVCAGRRGNERTFANSCMAERAGARIRYAGECQAALQPVPSRPGVQRPPRRGGDEVISDSPVSNSR
jgi:hypothetical protein